MMEHNEKDLKNQQEIIDKIMVELRKLADKVRNEWKEPIRTQLIQADVLLDTMRFLSDYNENVEILNKHYVEKHQKEKYASLERKELEREED